MRRGIHIAVALFAILVLIRPFDCLGGAFTRKAAACCVKGKCLPTSNADECCKGTTPAGSQLSAPTAPERPAVLAATMPAMAPHLIVPVMIAAGFVEEPAPAGSPPGFRLNLPLLI